MGTAAVITLAIACSAFFSMAEMAFIAANRIRLRHLAETGHRLAKLYQEYLSRPERLLSAAMMGVTIAHITASAVATSALLPTLGRIATACVTILLTPVMLVFGEMIPKAVAQQQATRLALGTLLPLRLAAWMLAPFVLGANAIVGGLLYLLGRRPEARSAFVSREDLRLLLELEDHESEVKEEEREMIGKIFDLGETTVREAMVPLVDVIAIPEEATVEEAIAKIQERGFSRLPVYQERIDQVVGVLTAMDLLRRGPEETTIKALIRPAHYVPETKRVDDLLREMQQARIQLAVVVDEYGGSVGIVTLEDIIEEIVGEIEGEHERRLTALEPLPDGSYLAAGRTTVEAVNEELEWTLPKGEYDTLGGLILSTLDRIPVPGEEVTIEGYHLTVVEADQRRILKVKLSPRRTKSQSA